ncbi:hypothetical protein [Pseudonocardia hydrocarbonoxydans]|uniref:DUF4386 domain-containing protein n=1 Tax=Pseudonocardia hydrocarbonoxydans TaxID=76726 RepID=A0A4Y3WSI2_9PSEU|nr:hypothetical protein [Pseudonocardia hydrocarbonoxydans]GEC21827.1 hypothetical protein PHY01_41100 [Pseudonocardia hydrocarbonoxydans]
MDRLRLLSLGGHALIASFVVSLAGGLAHPVVDGDAHSVASLTAAASPYAQILIYVGALLLMFGLPAAYAWLAPHVGRLGFAGFSLYFLGNAVSAQGHLVVEAFVAPEIARRAPELVPDDGSILDAPLFATVQVVGGLVLVAGLVVLGVALLRTPVVPRWIGIASIVAGVLAVTPLPEAPVLSGLQIELARGLAVAGLGVLMIRRARVGSVDAVHTPMPRTA